MLAKAVKQHQAAPPPQKGPTLSQQLFPSSSPLTSQEAWKTGLQNFSAPQIPRQAPSHESALQNSPSSVLNGPRECSRIGSSNPLKRAAPSRSVPSSLSRQDSIFNKQNVVDLTQPMTDEGRVGKLHDAVYFDENDFDDDADLDLDIEDPTSKGHLSASSFKLPAQLAKAPGSNHEHTSSLPVHWSSSPLQHKATPPNAGSLKRDVATSEIGLCQKKPLEPEVPIVRPSKRRTLPWLDTDGQTAEPQNDPPAHVQKIIDRKRKTLHGNGEESYTPLPKDKPNSPYPWNKTASAMKEEQKKLRQATKKVIRTSVGDEESLEAATTSKRKRVSRVFLSDEQRKVLELVSEEKKSVFFTGSAGTGKSVLLREIIKVLREKHKQEPDRVAVTASTGLAACNVGGVTLHSFGGIGLGKEPVPELIRKIKRNQKAKNRWMRTKVLIIDEISMVDGDLFDKLEGIARIIRNNGRPFGGIQLVITGDFFQLPPVPDTGRVSKFAFDAATWNTSIEHTIGLTQVFRQKDPDFANMLNEMRLGRLTPKSIEAFRSMNRPMAFDDDIQATELFPTRMEVDNANNMRMKNLGGSAVEYKAADGGSINEVVQRDRLLANCMAPPLVTLKKGAQVMLIKNIDETLVNGSLGKVVGFMDEKTFDLYHENEEEFQAASTMDLNDEDMNRSRKKLKSMINKDTLGSTSQKYPLVHFAVGDGTSRQLLVQHESWKIELPNGEVQASRSQIPLILAWALSIHKAQGQTLDRVKVDLGRVFEKGQAYVALSRATCQGGLQIMRFDPKKVMAHERVRSFYDSLYSIDQASRSTKPPAAASRANTKAAKDYERDYMDSGNGFEEDEDTSQQMYT